MDEPTRRAWSRPELIVIVRGGLEENVVATPCKGGFSGGPSSDDTACGTPAGKCSVCSAPQAG